MRHRDGKLHTVTVGSWLRDHEAVINTASILYDDNFSFHIVSYEPQGEIPETIKLHQGLSDYELLALYQSCDVVFLPFKDAAANNVLLEAMSCGLAVVSSDIIAVREYASEACGYFIQNNSPQKFADALNRFISDPERLEQMSNASRKRAIELAWPLVGKNLANIYQDIVAQDRRQRINPQKSNDNKPLQITCISTFSSGGAGRATHRLVKGLKESGAIAQMLCSKVNGSSGGLVEVDVPGLASDQHITQHYVVENRTPLSDTWFSLTHFSYLDIDSQYVAKADIINLHWVAHMVSPQFINRIIRLGKPIIWTLHDERPFTGGCHYTAGCNGFETGCRECLQLQDDWAELPASSVEEMAHALHGANLTVVAPSAWLAKEAGKSKLFKDFRIEVIPNGIETDIFFPEDKLQSKKGLGIDPNAVVLMFGAQMIGEKRKGFSKLIDALEICLEVESFTNKCDSGKIIIFCLGEADDEINNIPITKHILGYLNDDNMLRKVYSAANAFILPSLEDNFPNTILESMACGTPVIAFDTGGATDIISNDCGIIVPQGDTLALADAIIKFSLDTTLQQNLTSKCRVKIESHYTIKHQAEKYLALFNEVKNNYQKQKTKRIAPHSLLPSSSPFELVLSSIIKKNKFLFLNGWHQHEEHENDYWRWSSGEGTIRIDSSSDTNTVSLFFEIKSIHDRDDVTVSLNNIKIKTITCGHETITADPIKLNLQPGRNLLIFSSAKGSQITETDKRKLSFLVSNLQISPDSVEDKNIQLDKITGSNLQAQEFNSPNSSRIFFGLGWYPADGDECNYQHWAASKGIAHLKTVRQGRTRLQLILSSAFDANNITLQLNGQQITSLEVGQKETRFDISHLFLQRGTNILGFSSDKNPVTSPHNDKILNFMVNNLNFSDPKGTTILWGQSKLIRKLKKSGLFFSNYYRNQLLRQDMHLSPEEHYFLYGAWENKMPNPLFDSAFYLENNYDVYISGINPLLHYILHGWEEGRDPHPMFSTNNYLTTYPDVAESKMNPLLHYLKHGVLEGRSTSPAVTI